MRAGTVRDDETVGGSSRVRLNTLHFLPKLDQNSREETQLEDRLVRDRTCE